MPDAKLNLYNLGSLGVNVEKSPIHLEDGELPSAQNFNQNKSGVRGGIVNRPGLTKVSANGSSSILGFVGVSLGPGPGTSSDDSLTYYLADESGTWLKSSDSFASTSTIATIAGNSNLSFSTLHNGRLYYVSGNTLRVFDGIKDSLFCNLTYQILNVATFEGDLYVAANTSGTGFIFQIDDEGRATQIGAAIPGGYIPNAMCLNQNSLFVGSSSGGSVSKIWHIRLNSATPTTAWTQDYATAAADTSLSFLCSFNGLLYSAEDTADATASHVYQRSTGGTYTAVDTGSASGGIASGANALFVYQGNLYAHWDHNTLTTSIIRKTSDGTSWSTVKTYTLTPATGGQGVFYSTGSKLFLVAYDQLLGLYSADGTSWTTFTVPITSDAAFGFFTASGSGASFGATSSFTLFQGGSTLQLLNQAGSLISLVLPTGITLDASRPPRFATFDRFVVVVNTPSRPITVDAEGIVRVLTPSAPVFPINLASGGAGGLTGDYLAWQTFQIRDATGNIISESDYSPVMPTPLTAAANLLEATSLNISPDQITGSQLYRSTAGGTVKFPWIVSDGNVLTTSSADDTTDAALSLVAGGPLGTAPNMSLVASWRGRVWGVDRADVDNARYTEVGQMYAWPEANALLIGRAGSDARGVTSFLPRRDALGVGRRDALLQITGTGPTDFRVVTLSENVGVESQETVCIYKDVAYFLWKDGVYSWGSDGIKPLSDGKVGSWFTTDLFFNRGRFQYAFASIDPINSKYRLFLASLGSDVEDRWVEYDLTEQTWWGPHKTGAFSPTAAGVLTDANDRPYTAVASSSGFLWKDQSTATDDVATGIAVSLDTKFFDGDTPDIDKYWGEPSILGKVEAGGVLTITPKHGYLDATVGAPIDFTLSKGRQRLRRLGTGKMLQLNLSHTTAGEPIELYGIEIPFFELGRR